MIIGRRFGSSQCYSYNRNKGKGEPVLDLLGHTNLMFCFSDSAGLFLADFKKKIFKMLSNVIRFIVTLGQVTD